MPGPRRPRKIAFEVLLARTGMTVAELSDASGVPVRTIHEVRTRDFARAPAPKTVHGLAEVLGVSCAHLLRAVGVPADARKAFLRDSEASPRNAVSA